MLGEWRILLLIGLSSPLIGAVCKEDTFKKWIALNQRDSSKSLLAVDHNPDTQYISKNFEEAGEDPWFHAQLEEQEYNMCKRNITGVKIWTKKSEASQLKVRKVPSAEIDDQLSSDYTHAEPRRVRREEDAVSPRAHRGRPVNALAEASLEIIFKEKVFYPLASVAPSAASPPPPPPSTTTTPKLTSAATIPWRGPSCWCTSGWTRGKENKGTLYFAHKIHKTLFPF